MKQLKILVADYGHKVGDVVEYKLFSELTEDEVSASTGMPAMWEDWDIFVRDLEYDGVNCWGYMYDSEVEIIE